MNEYKHYRTTISKDKEVAEALHKLNQDWDLDNDNQLVYKCMLYTPNEENYL